VKRLPRLRQAGCCGATASAAEGRDENRNTCYAAIAALASLPIARYDSARGPTVWGMRAGYRSPSWVRGVPLWPFTALVLVEFVTGELPSPPSRKVPIQFGARVMAGALSSVTVAATGVSLAAGMVGAVVGAFAGASLRARRVAFIGEDHPSALIEDVIAILTVLLIVSVA
jgi:uncharacterized membrane protein